MTDLQQLLHKIRSDLKHVEQSANENPDLALTAAKRGRRDLTLVVRLLAEKRDNKLQPGGHKP